MRARSGAARPSLPLRTPWHWPHPFFAYTSQPAISAQSGANGSGGGWDACCCAAADAKRERTRQHAEAARRTQGFVALIRKVSCQLMPKDRRFATTGQVAAAKVSMGSRLAPFAT